MRIALAPDSFKESIGAVDVCRVLAEVLRARGHEPVPAPIADGGEGTVDAVLFAGGGDRVTCVVEDPLGRPVEAAYALLNDGRTALIEMAQASGLQRVPPEARDPMRASTFGTGQLIRDAIERGATKIVVALGGSATTDAGAGAAQALGVSLTDHSGDPIGRGGEALLMLHRVNGTESLLALNAIELIAACDVTNPLVGPTGAAHTYGPQKGATPDHVHTLDNALKQFADVVERDTAVAVADLPGSGAAGGLAAGLVALCGARIESGFATVAAVAGLESKIAACDCVITGEGKYDEQSAHGKAVSGVCGIAQRHGKPVHLIAGIVTTVPTSMFASVHALSNLAGDAQEAQRNPLPYLRCAAEAIADALEEA